MVILWLLAMSDARFQHGCDHTALMQRISNIWATCSLLLRHSDQRQRQICHGTYAPTTCIPQPG